MVLALARELGRSDLSELVATPPERGGRLETATVPDLPTSPRRRWPFGVGAAGLAFGLWFLWAVWPKAAPKACDGDWIGGIGAANVHLTVASADGRTVATLDGRSPGRRSLPRVRRDDPRRRSGLARPARRSDDHRGTPAVPWRRRSAVFLHESGPGALGFLTEAPVGPWSVRSWNAPAVGSSRQLSGQVTDVCHLDEPALWRSTSVTAPLVVS